MKTPKITIIMPFEEKRLVLKVSPAKKGTVACVEFGGNKPALGGVILTKDMDALCAAWRKVRK